MLNLSGLKIKGNWITLKEILENPSLIDNKEVIAVKVNVGYQYFTEDGVYLGFEKELLNGAMLKDNL